MHVRNVKAVT